MKICLTDKRVKRQPVSQSAWGLQSQRIIHLVINLVQQGLTSVKKKSRWASHGAEKPFIREHDRNSKKRTYLYMLL